MNAATQCHICEKDLGQEKGGRVDHLAKIKEWLDILELDTRRIPIKKELNKKVKEFEGVRYLSNGDEEKRIEFNTRVSRNLRYS